MNKTLAMLKKIKIAGPANPFGYICICIYIYKYICSCVYLYMYVCALCVCVDDEEVKRQTVEKGCWEEDGEFGN